MLFRSRATSSDQWTCVLAALAVSTLLFLFARDGLFVSLSEDDLMNLHYAAGEPLGRLLVANLFPFTTVYRPAGSAVYVAIFELVGFAPLYFRAATCIFLLLSCVAMYRLGALLDGRVLAGALAVIPLAFHSRLAHIYTENAYVYDVLCGALFAWTVYFYAHRRRYGSLRPWDVLILYLLWSATVNAKEIGLTLPVVLMAYEIVLTRPFLKRRLVWPGLLFVCSVVAWRGKVAPWSPLYNHASYEPGFDLFHVLQQVQKQVAEAVLASGASISVGVLAVIVVAFCGLALGSRSKAAQFGLWWIAITPWPILVIDSRPFSSLYIPWMGVCLVIGAVASEAFASMRLPDSGKLLAIPICALAWAGLQWTDTQTRPPLTEIGGQWEHVRGAIADYREIPRLCEAEHVLVLESRFGNDRYHPLFLKELYCGQKDPHVVIPGLNMSIEVAREQFETFDLVIVDDGEQARALGPSRNRYDAAKDRDQMLGLALPLRNAAR